jgi:copper homeostasis protein
VVARSAFTSRNIQVLCTIRVKGELKNYNGASHSDHETSIYIAGCLAALESRAAGIAFSANRAGANRGNANRTMPPPPRVEHPVCIEICVDSCASAMVAERAGADRIELCSNLREGGTTPSAGTIEVVRAGISFGLQVMVRPRSGDFCYSEEEFKIMRRDVIAARQFGANGVVIGLLKQDGRIDVARTRELVELARPLRVTFHRAFDLSEDLVRDPTRALHAVILTGADRVLTSGGKPTAMEARPILTNLVQAAQGRIKILACGGIDASNAATIIRDTGITEIHAGLRRPLQNAKPAHAQLSLGVEYESTAQRFEVREEDVRKLRSTVDAA